MECAGSLQLCAGQKAGCEAADHAMKEIYEEAETDAVLFVDASNAFNSMNRAALLHNIKYLCPAMSTYLRNCYRNPSRLFVGSGVEVPSAEGTTQGDPLAMPGYGIGILPLLVTLKIDNPEIKHVAYADDIGGGSKLGNVRQWWDKIVQFGPYLGYFPKTTKSWLQGFPTGGKARKTSRSNNHVCRDQRKHHNRRAQVLGWFRWNKRGCREICNRAG